MAPGTFSDIRNLHERGLISIACDKTNSEPSKFITVGTDGTLYLWDSSCLLEKNSPQIKNVGEATHSCIAWQGSDVYFGYTSTDLITGVDKRVVGKANIDDLESPHQILTFSLESTSVDVCKKYLVAGASDFTLKRFNLYLENYEKVELSGEILSINIEPKEDAELFAVSCTDGSVTVFNLEDLSKIASIPNVFPSFGSIDIRNPRGLMSWSTDGSKLFFPAKGCVKCISRSDWTVSNDMFKGKGTEGDLFSTARVSQCGSYLCASTISNKIVIWRIVDRELVSSNEYKRIAQGNCTITDVCFAPFDARSIIVTDANEGMCMWKNAIPTNAMSMSSSNESPQKAKSGRREILSDDEMEDEDEDFPRKSRKGNRTLIDDEADDDNGNDNGNEDDLGNLIEEREQEEGNTRMSADIGEIKRKFGFGGDGGTSALENYGFGGSKENSNMGGAATDFRDVLAPPAPITKVVEYEPPAIPSQFVSGSTPARLSHRYLKWNNYGVVRCFNSDEESNIEIEFHDSNVHSEILLDNSSTGFCLADLSDRAVALANMPEEKKVQGEMLVIHISSWDPESRRWTTKFPLKDAAVDVLVSREMIAVITEQRNIRIFTLTGTQRHVIAHPGPILTACIFGSRVCVASVTGGEYFEERRGHRKNKAQYQFSASTYDLDSKSWFRSPSNVASVHIPVSPGHVLDWIGFTNEGQLVTMDNGFTVRLLASGGFWMPIFDGSSEVKEKSDAIWPIGVVAGRQKQIRYLYCKGSKYPMLAVKMAPLIAPWSVPLCQPEAEKTQLEESLLLNELRQSKEFNDPDGIDLAELSSAHLQSIIKLFAIACKSERESRASELAHLVSSSKGIQVMCNYATSMKKQVLAEKVAAVGREQACSLDDSMFSQSSTITTNERLAPRRVSLNRRRTVNNMPQMNIPEVDEDQKEEGSEMGEEPSEVVPSSQQMDSLRLPIPTFTRNPFKRAADTPTLDTSSGSVFDQLEASFDNPRKRGREEEKKAPTSAKKQMKLSFGAAATPKGKGGKENTSGNAYTLWLEQNEEKMREMFSGEPDEFEKFCVGQFRILPTAEKKEWKARAAGEVV